MTEPNLELLMNMVQRVLDSQGEMREDIREIKARLGRLEAEIANLHMFIAEQSIRMDRADGRFERIERRLELREDG